MSKRKKRVLIISDLHCGHRVGLTPTTYLPPPEAVGIKYHKILVDLWAEYKKIIKKLKPIDILIVIGDCIDGRGVKSKSTELIAADRKVQANMAAYCINHIEAKSIVMTRGTPYHVGDGHDYEDDIKEHVNAKKIGDHEWVEVNGVIFDCKHHIGNSSVPYGQQTQIAKDQLWNFIWSEYEEQPKSDIVVRSHVHQFNFVGGPDWLGITTPSLQGAGSKFGAQRMSKIVHWGVVWFDVEANGGYSWDRYVARVVSQRAKVLKL